MVLDNITQNILADWPDEQVRKERARIVGLIASKKDYLRELDKRLGGDHCGG